MGEEDNLTAAPRRLELNRKHSLVKELAAMAAQEETPAVLM